MNTPRQPSSHRKTLQLNRIQTCPAQIVLTPQLLAEHSPHRPLYEHVQGSKAKHVPGRGLGDLFTPKKRLFSDIQSSPQRPHTRNNDMQDNPQVAHIPTPSQYNTKEPGTRLFQRIKSDSCLNSQSETVNPKKRLKLDDSQTEAASCSISVRSKFIYVTVCLFTLIAITIGLLNMGQSGKVELKHELCSNSSQYNLEGLSIMLNSQVFGQHIAMNQILLELEDYLVSDASEPLMLMFSGWTGTGKSYMVQLVASLIPATSHIYILPHHFPNGEFQHSNEPNHTIIHKTKQTGSSIQESNLAFAIKNKITKCALNIFILDDFDIEMDHIVDELQKFYISINDLRKSKTKVVIIVISSIGSAQINSIALEHLLHEDPRDSFNLSIFHKEIKAEVERVYPSIGRVFQFQYIPFLPLESSHVAKCIQKYITSTTADRSFNGNRINDYVQRVLKLVSFFPSKKPIFSVSGCKNVGTLVDITTLE
ncbi:unnamed protein product [Owenia fusiformis]|uniref:Uncharacterized protein n=1 Tax=Owenia fusiformis TaxID=6347 RepID=A0A8S4PTJ7_OWEFU|nr:unnamed protein product [Owenia fusiformis]